MANMASILNALLQSNNESTPRIFGAAKRKPSKPQILEEPDDAVIRSFTELLKNPGNLEEKLKEFISNGGGNQLLPIDQGMDLNMKTMDSGILDNNGDSSNNNGMIKEEPLDNNSNNEMEEEEVDEWQIEFKKLEKGNSTNMDKKDKERRRQMEKNREYARKCVQKKKDMRKQAEIRSLQIFRRVQLQQKFTAIKERNANFAVDLRKMMDEHGVEEHRKTYEEAKKETKRLFEERFAVDETVNLNFHRWSSSQEEFTKASNDLQNKKGVIGTLGSRKIRAKQQMQWREHLYNISVHEHQLRRELELATLADDYVKRTVPEAAPLVQSIPKHLLDELIQNDRTFELEEFVRFVGDNAEIFNEEDSASVIK